VGDNVSKVTSLAKVGLDPVSGRYATWGATHMNRFSRTIAQKTRSGVGYGRPFCDDKCIVVKFGEYYPKNTHNWSEWAITSQTKMLNNFQTGRDTRNISMNHDYETGAALSDSVMKSAYSAPWRKNYHDAMVMKKYIC